MPKGFGIFVGPKEKSGRRKPGESLRQMREREAREARQQAQQKKQARRAGKAASKTTVAANPQPRMTAVVSANPGKPGSLIIDRDLTLMAAVESNDSELDEHAEAILDFAARLEALEAVEDAKLNDGEANIGFLGNGISGILAFVDPLIATINAADVPVSPIAAQAAALVRSTGETMGGGLFGGLGKPAMKLITTLLTAFAYYKPGEGFISLFQTDGGGILATSGTAAPTTGGGLV